MTKHTMPAANEGNVNVTPLIDVVMCLIIFYMYDFKANKPREAP